MQGAIKRGGPAADTLGVKKFLQVVLVGLAAVIVAGTIAGAAPGLNDKPSGGQAPSVAPEPPAPEPTETETPDPSDTETETPDPTDTGSAGVAPDFSSCAGLTGLENAICRHDALLAVDPANTGLANSLAQLQANLAKKQAHDAAKAAAVHGNSGSAPGHSGESHGHSGSAPGHSNN